MLILSLLCVLSTMLSVQSRTKYLRCSECITPEGREEGYKESHQCKVGSFKNSGKEILCPSDDSVYCVLGIFDDKESKELRYSRFCANQLNVNQLYPVHEAIYGLDTRVYKAETCTAEEMTKKRSEWIEKNYMKNLIALKNETALN